ncbi:MAG: 6-bladed beta-propeller [Salinibacter sp.]
MIGNPKSLAVDNDGRLYVADAERSFVWIFSPRGDSIGVIGRQGRGPGEFLRPSSVRVGPNDSLFVLDGMIHRVSVFAPDSTRSFAYSFRLPLSQNRLPSAIYPTQSGRLAARYTRPKNPNLRAPGHWIMRVNRRGDILQDSLLYLPLKEIYVEEPSPGHLRSVTPPFGRRPVFSYGTERGVCFGWNARLRIRCWTLGEAATTVLNVEHTPYPVSDEEIRLSRQGLPDELVPMIEKKGWHDTHPAFLDMFVDRAGRFWIIEPSGRMGAGTPSYSWHLVDLDTRTFWSVHLPPRMRIRAATRKYAYGTRVSDPTLFVFRIKTGR